MRVYRIVTTFLLVACACAFPVVTTAQAQDDFGLQQRLLELEAQVASLRSDAAISEIPVHVREYGSLETYGANCSCCPTTTCSTGRLYGGAAAVFAKPHFKEAFKVSATNLGSGELDLIPFSYDYSATPRVWLGYQTPSGLGVRADYWQFDADGDQIVVQADGQFVYGSHAVTIIFPATILASMPGETLVAQDGLRTDIVNLLATGQMQFGKVSINGGAGLRYGRLEQTISTSVVGGGMPRALNWVRTYEGVGPAVGVDFRRPIGCTGFAAVARGGGALLFGSKNLSRVALGDVGMPPAAPFLRLNDADEVVGIGELSFGLEWTRILANGSQLAVQGQYEGQLWAEAGSPTLGFLGFEGFGVFAELRR